MTEAELKRACVQLLELYKNQGKLLYVRNNSFAGRLTRPDGSQGFIKNNSKGAPDFFVFLGNQKYGPTTHHIELKTEKGKLSDEQEVWSKKCADLGHFYVVIRDLEQLQKIIKEYA